MKHIIIIIVLGLVGCNEVKDVDPLDTECLNEFGRPISDPQFRSIRQMNGAGWGCYDRQVNYYPPTATRGSLLQSAPASPVMPLAAPVFNVNVYTW